MFPIRQEAASPYPSQWIVSMQSNGRSLATFLGDCTVSGSFIGTLSGVASYSNVAALQAAVVPASASSVLLAGYFSVGDNGGAQYIRSGVAGPGNGLIQSADGQWWVIVLPPGGPSPEMFGAKGDGVTDDTAAFTAAVGFMSSNPFKGGRVLCSFKTYVVNNLVLPSGVTIEGPQVAPYAPSLIYASRLLSTLAGWTVKTAVNAVACGVIGLQFSGQGAGTSIGGFQFAAGSVACIVRDCEFDQYANSAIQEASGTVVASQIIRNRATNCLLSNGGLAAFTGVCDIHGTDAFLDSNEFSGPVLGHVSSANLFLCAMALNGAQHALSNNVGEFADIGLYSNALNCRLSNNREDHNYGHGLYLDAGAGGTVVAANLALNNSQGATNTYDGVQNHASNCVFASSMSYSSGAPAHRFGYNDFIASDAGKNIYSPCVISIGAATASWNVPGGGVGSSIADKTGPAKTLAVNSTTPNVDQYSSWASNNTLATTISNFLGAVDGQKLELFAIDANTTIAQNANIHNSTGANITLTAGQKITYRLWGGVWRQWTAPLAGS